MEESREKEVFSQNVSLQTEKEKTVAEFSSDSEELLQKEEIIDIPSEKEMIISSPSVEITITEEVVHSSEEPQSIIIIDETMETKDIKQENIKPTEIKEFFPNFQITDTINLDEDLLDLQDSITIKDHQKPIINKEAILITEEISPIEVSTDTFSPISNVENIIVQDIAEISPKESSTETISVSEESTDTGIITPEYVAEVKMELSEGRRAGFRFFLQKKTKILAGAGIVVLSLSAIALFSGAFFQTDVQKS